MTQNAFLSLVRQYARLSARYQRSFAPAVEAVVEKRISTIMQSDFDEDVKDEMIERVTLAAGREYHKLDVWKDVPEQS